MYIITIITARLLRLFTIIESTNLHSIALAYTVGPYAGLIFLKNFQALPSFPLSCSLPFCPLPYLHPITPLPSIPLERGPLNPTRASGGALSAPHRGSGAELQPKSNLVHFGLKI